MDGQPQKSRSVRKRFRFGLPVLFGFIAIFSLVLAYPRFVFSAFTLFFGTILALLAFVVLVYYPVSLVANWIYRWWQKLRPTSRRTSKGHSTVDRH
jgi:hypothetical protein